MVLLLVLGREETKLRFQNTATNSVKVKINLQKARRTPDNGEAVGGRAQAGLVGAERKCRASFVLTKGTWRLTVRGQSRMSTLLSTPI